MTIFGALDTLATLAQQVYHAGQIMFSGPPHPFAVDEAAPEAERCAREAGFTSSPVKHGPGSRLAEPHLRRESIAAGATLSSEADERLADSVFRSGGQTYEMGPRPKLSTPGPKVTGAVQAAAAAISEATAQRFADLEVRVARLATNLTSAAPGTASPAAAAESPASSDTATSAAADAGHPASSAAHSQTADERPGATPLAPGPPTFTAAELVDAAGAVTRMALLRGVASGNVAYWLALSAKFYDAADAISDASTPPEYVSQLADIGRDALLETLANDPDSVHGRALRHEDERQK